MSLIHYCSQQKVEEAFEYMSATYCVSQVSREVRLCPVDLSSSSADAHAGVAEQKSSKHHTPTHHLFMSMSPSSSQR